MTAQIFDLARYQSKKALKPETLEQQAVSIINVALADHLDPAWTPIGPNAVYHYADDKIYVAPETDPA